MRWALLAIAAVILCAGACLWLFRPAGESAAAQRLDRAAEGLTDYTLSLRLSTEEHTLAITEDIAFRNDTGDVLDHLMLRTWLNAFAQEDTSPAALDEIYADCYPQGFSPGYLEWFDVTWAGERAEYAYANGDQTALRIAIPALKPGESGTLRLRCVAHLPECAHRTGYTGGEYRLGNVVPVLSLFEDGAWRTDEYSPIGDPFVSECANFSVSLSVPAGFVPVCSAPLTQGQNGLWQGGIRAARDVALWIRSGCCRAEGSAAGVTVYSFAETEAEARRALGYACRAMETFSALYGDAPYPVLQICSADFPFGGMEYPGLCMIGRGNYLESRADSLELTVAHEVAHQWFYGQVGSDQVKNAWQDESICEYAMLRYVQKRYGQGSFETLKSYRVDAPMRESIPGTLTPGSPIDYFGSLADYSAVVYGRGAALWLALDAMLPKGADDFLRAYAQRFAFCYVTRGQMEAYLNEYAGMDLGPLLADYLDTVQ